MKIQAHEKAAAELNKLKHIYVKKIIYGQHGEKKSTLNQYWKL